MINLPHKDQILDRIKNAAGRVKEDLGLWWDRINNYRYAKNNGDPFVIQRNIYKEKTPVFRGTLINCSLIEDEENPYYSGVLNTLSEHCCGSIPIPVALVEENDLCDSIEDRFIQWGVENKIGSAIREMRRVAARTGIAVAIPIRIETEHDIKLSFQIVGAEYLKSPTGKLDVIDGVEFYDNGQVKAVYIQEDGKLEPTKYYNMPSNKRNKCIVFSRQRVHKFWPECAPAFQMYPSIRRYITNVLKTTEMQTSIPMALEFDPNYWPVNVDWGKDKFEYEPGFVPNLPPGVKLSGLDFGKVSEDRSKFVDLMVGSASRCINMPTILALGDSSDSNMATAHIDLQPWSYAVKIDRFDFEQPVRYFFWMWYDLASMMPGYLPSSARRYRRPPITFHYNVLFEHPDPGKRANARATDLESGAATLTRIYNEQGLVARREIQKDCKLFGITPKEYFKLLLQARGQMINGSQKTGTKSQSDSQSEETDTDRVRGLLRRAS